MYKTLFCCENSYEVTGQNSQHHENVKFPHHVPEQSLEEANTF